MTGFGLVIILFIGIAFIVFATSKLKLHPFLALLLAAYGIGLLAGVPIMEIGGIITKGFGKILEYIGIVIVLGTMIGIILERSGAAIQIANYILKTLSNKYPVLAINIIGMIVSIPVFCDSGFVILSSLKRSIIQKTKISAVAMSVALATGLFATHTLVPPTPGPIAAAGNLGLDNLGLLILLGLLTAIITSLIGCLWAVKVGSRYQSELDQHETAQINIEQTIIDKYGKLPSTLQSFAPILTPIILMSIASIIQLVIGSVESTNFFLNFFLALGKPVNALLIGLFAAIPLLKETNKETLYEWPNKAILSAGSILIITGAGGALGAVIKETNIGHYLGDSLQHYELGIFVPFIIAAALKTAQGSSTTALVVTSTIIAPLLASLGLDSDMGKVLAVLAIGAGAMTVSHANDSFFWVVSQFSKMEVKVAYKAFTTATLAQGISTIAFIYLLSLILL